MQIVRLNCAFSRNLGRGDDVDGLGAIMRGILKRSPPSQIEYIDTDRGIVDISCRPERTGTGTVRHHHGADENCRGRNRGIEAYPPNGMGAALQ